jgi:hypothetical protein
MGDVMAPPNLMGPRNHTGSRSLCHIGWVSFVTTMTDRDEGSGGDFDALLAVLDPDVVLRADHAAVQAGASSEVRGAAAVADTFSGRARAAQPALINGAAGAVWAPGGRPCVVFRFTITHGKIVGIDLLADPARLSQLDLAVLDD